MLRLWIHEAFRVFSDRLINVQDRTLFIETLGDKLASFFDSTFHSLCPTRSSPVFTEVLSKDAIYEDIQNMETLRNHFMGILTEYNSSPGMISMDLVLFKDAVEHSKRFPRCVKVKVVDSLKSNSKKHMGTKLPLNPRSRWSPKEKGRLYCKHTAWQTINKDTKANQMPSYHREGVNNPAANLDRCDRIAVLSSQLSRVCVTSVHD